VAKRALAGCATVSDPTPPEAPPGAYIMAEHVRNEGAGEDEEERIPAMQHLLDNPFLLLFLGVAIPTVLYILWGVMEILTIPNAPM
jgi:hypothetical protein